ncbi:MAG: maleylacetate reductase [Pseudomonadota bacterium]
MSYFQPRFTARAAPVRVRFGAGVRRELADEITALGCNRALILSTPPQSETALEFAEMIGTLAAGVFTRAAMHTPVEISEEATSYANEIAADCVIAVGGGSTTGLGKAIAYRTDLPQLVVPTTYSGSEATPILGQTDAGRKTTLTDAKVQPEVIMYDAELVSTLPIPMTVTSALNAMAHAVEALYARDRNPLSTALAVEGLTAFATALPRVIDAPDDLDARGETLYGAWLCGTVLGQVGMALHHKLCHTLGGSLDLPHAETHAIILPHAIAFNEVAVPDLLRPAAEALGGATAGSALYDFAEAAGAPMALRGMGLVEAELDRAARLATENPYWNPREVDRPGIRALLQRAWDGARPAA